MTKSITEVSPSGNCQPSKVSGNVTQEQERIWAEQLAATLSRHKQKLQAVKAQYSDVVGYSKYRVGDHLADHQRQFDGINDGVTIDRETGEYTTGWSDTRVVSEVAIGEQDILISCSVRGGRSQVGGGLRGRVTEFSLQSRRRLERHIRNLKGDDLKCMLTLTYPEEFPTDGVKVKRDLAVMKKRLKRLGVKGGVWFLEFQRRGAPHYHCYMTQWPTGGVDSVSKAWYEVVGSGDTKHLEWHRGGLSGRPCLEMLRNPHAASYYATKYALKDTYQKVVPSEYLSVGRFWGYWGGLKPVWSVYYARGTESAHAAVQVLRAWRFVKFGGMIEGSPLAYSGCLRGGSSGDDFDWVNSLMSQFGWCPDG